MSVNFDAASDIGTDYYYVQQFFKPGYGAQTDFINNSPNILAQSNVASQNVRSGVKEYYYIIDNNPNTQIDKQQFGNAQNKGTNIADNYKIIQNNQYNTLYKFQVEIPYKVGYFDYNDGFQIQRIKQQVVVDEVELEDRSYSLEFNYNMDYSDTYIHVVAVDASGNIGQTKTIKVNRPLTITYNPSNFTNNCYGDTYTSFVNSTNTRESNPDNALSSSKYIKQIAQGNQFTTMQDTIYYKGGYTLVGWQVNANAKPGDQDIIKINTEVKVSQLAPYADSNGYVTLYAIWEPKTYNIEIYDSLGDSGGNIIKTYTGVRFDQIIDLPTYINMTYSVDLIHQRF